MGRARVCVTIGLTEVVICAAAAAAAAYDGRVALPYSVSAGHSLRTKHYACLTGARGQHASGWHASYCYFFACHRTYACLLSQPSSTWTHQASRERGACSRGAGGASSSH